MTTNHLSDPATMLDGAQAHAIALAMYNAVAAQQQGAALRQAATTMICTAILSLGVAEVAESTAPLQPPADDTVAEATAPEPVAAALASAKDRIVQPLAAGSVQLGGKAYQSVAQSTALAIQDAADYLRTMATIATTANGVAMAQILANPAGAAEYVPAIAAAREMIRGAVVNFEAIGVAAETVLGNFARPEG